MPETTWVPYDIEGYAAERNSLPDSSFAFPFSREEPTTDSQHVRGAIARFDQVEDASSPWRKWRVFCKAGDVAEDAIRRSIWQLMPSFGFGKADSGLSDRGRVN
jgi:hypothetical protein